MENNTKKYRKTKTLQLLLRFLKQYGIPIDYMDSYMAIHGGGTLNSSSFIGYTRCFYRFLYPMDDLLRMNKLYLKALSEMYIKEWCIFTNQYIHNNNNVFSKHIKYELIKNVDKALSKCNYIWDNSIMNSIKNHSLLGEQLNYLWMRHLIAKNII